MAHTSVPIPGTISPNLYELYIDNKIDQHFRPHSGDYISKSITDSGRSLQTNFRPHSGDYISKLALKNFDEMIGLLPSPFRGLYLQMIISVFYAFPYNLLPSPFRGLYLQILSSTPTVLLHSQEYYAWESKLYMEI